MVVPPSTLLLAEFVTVGLVEPVPERLSDLATDSDVLIEVEADVDEEVDVEADVEADSDADVLADTDEDKDSDRD
ncbi:hypothetical protein [Streptococcus infantis]|uniref:hypothetical protein n=1 Tax=Streptococcus infantis TaxID=68892 RepID=UPI0039C464F5